MGKLLKKWLKQLFTPIVREVIADREKEIIDSPEELDVYFINGTDKEKRTLTVPKIETVNSKKVFVEITNENQGEVTFP